MLTLTVTLYPDEGHVYEPDAFIAAVGEPVSVAIGDVYIEVQLVSVVVAVNGMSAKLTFEAYGNHDA